MQMKFEDIQALAEELKIEPDLQYTGKMAFVIPIANHGFNLKPRTKGETWIHENIIYGPMCAASQTAVSPEDFTKLVESGRYIATEKIDGNRCLITYFPDEGLGFFGRSRSVIDFQRNNHTDQIWSLTREQTKNLAKKSFVLDGEIHSVNKRIGNLVAATNLEVISSLLNMNYEDSLRLQEENPNTIKITIFDVLMFDDKLMMNYEYSERKKMVDVIVKGLHSREEYCPGVKRFDVIKQWEIESNEKLMQDFNDLVTAGGEGMVLKAKTSKYYPIMSRNGVQGDRHPWIKLKSTVTQLRNIAGESGSDLDAFVGGFECGSGKNEGIVSTLHFYVYDSLTGEEYHLCSCSNFTDEEKRIMTIQEGSEVKLNPEYWHRVATLEGTDISAKNHRMMHARFIRWREDKIDFDCLMNTMKLKEMVL